MQYPAQTKVLDLFESPYTNGLGEPAPMEVVISQKQTFSGAVAPKKRFQPATIQVVKSSAVDVIEGGAPGSCSSCNKPANMAMFIVVSITVFVGIAWLITRLAK